MGGGLCIGSPPWVAALRAQPKEGHWGHLAGPILHCKGGPWQCRERRGIILRPKHVSTPSKSSAPLPLTPRREGRQPRGEAGAAAGSRTWQVDLQLGVAHAGVAAPGAVLLHHVRAAVLQQVVGETAPVLGDPPVLPPLADEAHLARAGGHAAVRHVAHAQQLVCRHEDSARCATGPGRAARGQRPPVSGMLVALGSTGSMLKTLEPAWDHQEAAEGMCRENASIPWAVTTNWAALARSAQPGGRILPVEPQGALEPELDSGGAMFWDPGTECAAPRCGARGRLRSRLPI